MTLDNVALPQVSVVVPVFNERDNIAPLVHEITAAVDETALAADSMSATIGAIREDTESVASDIERVGQGFAVLDSELGTLKNSAGEFIAKVAA